MKEDMHCSCPLKTLKIAQLNFYVYFWKFFFQESIISFNISYKSIQVYIAWCAHQCIWLDFCLYFCLCSVKLYFIKLPPHCNTEFGVTSICVPGPWSFKFTPKVNCHRTFFWTTISRIMTWRIFIDYESLTLG